ncbi:shikimate kinase, partial [Oenococcus oeni]
MIFSQKLVKHFRKMETVALKKAINQNVILSTGGGAPIKKLNQT